MPSRVRVEITVKGRPGLGPSQEVKVAKKGCSGRRPSEVLEQQTRRDALQKHLSGGTSFRGVKGGKNLFSDSATRAAENVSVGVRAALVCLLRRGAGRGAGGVAVGVGCLKAVV